MTQENEQAQDASVVTDVQAKPVQAVNEAPAQEPAPAQAPAHADEQKMKTGDGCFLIDPFNDLSFSYSFLPSRSNKAIISTKNIRNAI